MSGSYFRRFFDAEKAPSQKEIECALLHRAKDVRQACSSRIGDWFIPSESQIERGLLDDYWHVRWDFIRLVGVERLTESKINRAIGDHNWRVSQSAERIRLEWERLALLKKYKDFIENFSGGANAL